MSRSDNIPTSSWAKRAFIALIVLELVLWSGSFIALDGSGISNGSGASTYRIVAYTSLNQQVAFGNGLTHCNIVFLPGTAPGDCGNGGSAAVEGALIGAATIKRIYAHANASIGAGNSLQIQLMKNGAASGDGCTIDDLSVVPDQDCDTGALSVASALTDVWAYDMTGSATLTGGGAGFSIILEVQSN